MSRATDEGSAEGFHPQYSAKDLDDLEISFGQNVCWPVIAWSVDSPEEMPGNGFFVDLGQFASARFGNRPLTRLMRSREKNAPQRAGRVVAPNWQLTLALAPSIRDWSQDKLFRSVKEEMSKLGWFYRFWHERSKLTPGFESKEVPCIDPEMLERLDVTVGFEFADWLRHQKCSDARRKSVYDGAKFHIETAIGRTVWRANPFAGDDRALTGAALPSVTTAQFRALMALSKDVVRRTRLDRQSLLRNRRIPGQPELADEVARVRVALAAASATGMEPARLNTVVLPSVDLVCASFLLCLCRLASNEQPLLDARQSWSAPNPFNGGLSNIVLWKNRSGGKRGRSSLRRRGPKRLQIPSSRKPFFHGFQQLRMIQRLTNPLRARLGTLLSSGTDARTKAALEKLAASFWLYVGDDGQFRILDGSNIHRCMNEFIARHATSYPELVGPDGEVVSYSAKAIRDGYLEFVTKKAGSDLSVGQTELSHGEQSNAIRTYLRKRWARKYVKSGFSRWQVGVFDRMRDPDADLSPVVLRGELSIEGTRVRDLTKRISVPPKRRASKVAHGLYCQDAANPPEEIRILLPGEEFCPAESCFDCAWARCYDDSLPEIAHDILALQRDRDCGPLHLWQGSESAVRLQKLEELFARWPLKKQADAMELAASWELPPSFFGMRR